MSNGGLRINKPLHDRRSPGEARRRAAKRDRRAVQQEERRMASSEAFLRERGFVLPDRPGQVILS